MTLASDLYWKYFLNSCLHIAEKGGFGGNWKIPAPKNIAQI
jgi:hypothetical protein